jgi:hypothetical protein
MERLSSYALRERAAPPEDKTLPRGAAACTRSSLDREQVTKVTDSHNDSHNYGQPQTHSGFQCHPVAEDILPQLYHCQFKFIDNED